MRDQVITFSDDELKILEQVRQQEGLNSIEQTAEWLAKRRLRWQIKQITGRGRAMYLVERTQE